MAMSDKAWEEYTKAIDIVCGNCRYGTDAECDECRVRLDRDATWTERETRTYDFTAMVYFSLVDTSFDRASEYADAWAKENLGQVRDDFVDVKHVKVEFVRAYTEE